MSSFTLDTLIGDVFNLLENFYIIINVKFNIIMIKKYKFNYI